jgi:hypothetical protein
MVEHRVLEAEAVRLVRSQLERERRRYVAVYGRSDVDLQITSVVKYEMGWLVSYRAADEVRDVAKCPVLVGHSPYLVDGEDGRMFLVPGRAFVADEWRDEYLYRLKGKAWPEPIQTAQEIRDVLDTHGRLAAIKYVRARVEELRLEASVALVDDVGRGEPLPAELRGRPVRGAGRKFAAPIQPVVDPNTAEDTQLTASPTEVHPRLVGDFHELAHGRAEGPSIRWAVRGTAAPHEPELLKYLRAGTMLAASPGITPDVLGAQDTFIGSLSLLTDGVWLWYSDLAYYVEHYHLELDPSFTAHARGCHWNAPTPTPEELLTIEHALVRATP